MTLDKSREQAEKSLVEALAALQRLREGWVAMTACLDRIGALRHPQVSPQPDVEKRVE